MNEIAKANINAVITTLNLITVSGKQNMDMLLGCIIALEKTLADCEKGESAE